MPNPLLAASAFCPLRAIFTRDDRGQFLDHPGSAYFLDPMIIKSDRADVADFAQDVWAFGMLMYGLLKHPTAECPWPWLTRATREERFVDACFLGSSSA